MSWYHTVVNDITTISDCIAAFETEYNVAKKDCKIIGNIEKNAADMPGIVEHRFNQLQELEAILHYLEIELKRLKSFHYKKYLESYNRALSSREVDKYVEGEDEVVTYEKIINEFALLRNKWLSISKGLDVKAWQLTNIVKLRCAGIEDSSI